MTSSDVLRGLDAILDDRAISTWFQPVIDLNSHTVVAYEGLCRGPDVPGLQTPAELFDAARDAGRLEDLDWQCRINTLSAALAAGLRPPLTVFMNVEPDVLTAAPKRAEPVLARAIGGLRVIVELTERALFEQPATLLRFVEAVRHMGWGIAVDDIGANPHSLAMLSIIEPDVVKLDQALLASMPLSASTAVVSGVQTYCRRSGACVVAEGLETKDDVDTARVVGAHYGQGWWFGDASPAPTAVATRALPVPLISPRPHLPTQRLINLTTRTQPPQRADWQRVERITGYMLEHATQMGPNTLVIACVQELQRLTPKVRTAFSHAAVHAAHVGLLGADLPPEPIPGVVGTSLSYTDPLVSEWVVVTIGLQEAIAFVASDLGDDYENADVREYDYAITYEPQMVTDVARALLSRVDGTSPESAQQAGAH